MFKIQLKRNKLKSQRKIICSILFLTWLVPVLFYYRVGFDSSVQSLRNVDGGNFSDQEHPNTGGVDRVIPEKSGKMIVGRSRVQDTIRSHHISTDAAIPDGFEMVGSRLARVYVEKLTQRDASMRCQNLYPSARLFIIRTNDDAIWISEQFDENLADRIWLGLNMKGSTMKWIDGTGFSGEQEFDAIIKVHTAYDFTDGYAKYNGPEQIRLFFLRNTSQTDAYACEIP